MIKIVNLLMIVAIILCLLDINMWVLVVGRFLWGLAIGSLTVFVPKFINETAPTELKGPLGGISQIMCCTGILVPSLLALIVPQTINELDPGFYVTQWWRVVWGVPIIISLLNMLALSCCYPHESPQTLKEND